MRHQDNDFMSPDGWFFGRVFPVIWVTMFVGIVLASVVAAAYAVWTLYHPDQAGEFIGRFIGGILHGAGIDPNQAIPK